MAFFDLIFFQIEASKCLLLRISNDNCCLRMKNFALDETKYELRQIVSREEVLKGFVLHEIICDESSTLNSQGNLAESKPVIRSTDMLVKGFGETSIYLSIPVMKVLVILKITFKFL